MPENMKDFIILCTNTKKKTIKLRIKNMPDFDERENIAFLRKQIQHISNLLSAGLLIGLTFGIIISWIWIIRYHLSLKMVAVYATIGLYFLVFLKLVIEWILKMQLIKGKGCDYIWHCMGDYSNANWNSVLDGIESAHSIFNLLQSRTSEGKMVYTDPKNDANITISLDGTCFMLDWISYVGNGDRLDHYELFPVRSFVKKYMPEKDMVEFDFIKNELIVPLENI